MRRLFNPSRVHGFDVGSLAGNMTVFRRVIIADNEMSYVWGQIVFVKTPKLFDLGGDFGLFKAVGESLSAHECLILSQMRRNKRRLCGLDKPFDQAVCWCSRQLRRGMAPLHLPRAFDHRQVATMP